MLQLQELLFELNYYVVWSQVVFRIHYEKFWGFMIYPETVLQLQVLLLEL